MHAIKLGKISKIVLNRWEGPIKELEHDSLCIVKSFKEADNVLNRWRKSAPDYGQGYNKVEFKVLFKDGTVHEGRYDLNKANNRGYADSPTLKGHIIDFIKYRRSMKKESISH